MCQNFSLTYITLSSPFQMAATYRQWVSVTLSATRLTLVSIVNFIFYYGTQFFKNAGIQNAFLITVATSIVNVFMTLPGLYGVERYGRRSLLLVGAAGMTICEFIVAIIGVTVSTSNLAGQRVLIAFVCIYIVSRVRHVVAFGFNRYLSGRRSLPRPGVPSLGSSLVKSSPCKYARKPFPFQQPVTGCGTSPLPMLVSGRLPFVTVERD